MYCVEILRFSIWSLKFIWFAHCRLRGDKKVFICSRYHLGDLRSSWPKPPQKTICIAHHHPSSSWIKKAKTKTNGGIDSSHRLANQYLNHTRMIGIHRCIATEQCKPNHSIANQLSHTASHMKWNSICISQQRDHSLMYNNMYVVVFHKLVGWLGYHYTVTRILFAYYWMSHGLICSTLIPVQGRPVLKLVCM